MPGSGGSKSSSTNTTQTTTQDNRVAASDSAIALGNGATFNYTDQFSPEVRAAFDELVGLARDAGVVATGFAEKAIQSNEKALDSVTATVQKAQDLNTLQDGVIFKQALPYVAVTLIVLGLASAYGRRKK